MSQDRRGPVHTILKLGYHDQMHTVYTQSKEVLAKFLLLVLPDAIGRRKWNRLSKALKPSKFVSCSDEAFAMIVIASEMSGCERGFVFGLIRIVVYRPKQVSSARGN